MKALHTKIKNTITEDNNHIKLTGQELVALVKSKKATTICLGIDTKLQINEEQYYPNYQILGLSKSQAIEYAKDWEKRASKREEEVFSEVYISIQEWNKGNYYVIL